MLAPAGRRPIGWWAFTLLLVSVERKENTAFCLPAHGPLPQTARLAGISSLNGQCLKARSFFGARHHRAWHQAIELLRGAPIIGQSRHPASHRTTETRGARLATGRRERSALAASWSVRTDRKSAV